MDQAAISSPDSRLPGLLAGKRLPMLDGLRAVSVGMVMIYHFGLDAPAGLGVTVFFVLSGFLITWLLLREHEGTGTVSLRGFYLRRTLRIFPAYYVFILASIVADRLLHDPWTGAQIAVALGYGINYFNAVNGHDATPAAHAWSLAVEEQFYLLWPVLFILLARRGRRALEMGLLAAVVAAPLWRAVLYLGLDFPTHYIYNAFDTRYDTLAIGCLMAALSRRAAFIELGHAIARRPWYPLVTAALLALSQARGTEGYAYTIGYTVDSTLIAILVLQLLQMRASALWSWLEHPLPRFLGVISYPMYLWHGWGLGVGHRFATLPLAAQFAIGAAATIAAGSWSYFLIERPVLALRPRLERILPRTGRVDGVGLIGAGSAR